MWAKLLQWMPAIASNLPRVIDAAKAAWQAFLARLPDRRELTPYQIERTRQIFVAGWIASEKAV